jgi:hypothetical protein
MKRILTTSIEREANNKLNELHIMNKKGIIKHYPSDNTWRVYETSKLEPDESMLPKWAQSRIQYLRRDIANLETIKKMSTVIADRDWFTLPNAFGGCDRDILHLWILTSDHPFSVCSLYKGDMLFIGRAKR